MLFSISVSRADWQRQPQVQTWLRYFGSSPVLLGLNEAPSNTAAVANISIVNAEAGESFDGLPLVPDNLEEILANPPPLLH